MMIFARPKFSLFFPSFFGKHRQETLGQKSMEKILMLHIQLLLITGSSREFHYCEFHYCGFSKLLIKFC